MKTVTKKLSQLRPLEKNVRKHNDKQISEYVRSLKMFGQLRPMVVDETGTILVGNGMYEAMKRIERQKEKHKYVFENYHNRQQIEGDYGYDAITLRQYREYLRIWDDVHEDNTKYEDRLRFIDRQIRTSQSNLEEMKLIMKNGDPYDGRR